MKKVALLAIMFFAIVACGTKTPYLQPDVVPTAKTLGDRQTHYASGDHLQYSLWGFRNGADAEEVALAQSERWWGEFVQ